ncbi:protein kinase [Sphaerimonospora cavernae]|uniref:non-specific serine/threonine protein kinase n=1 Tax=Sphaerimonospora cavernae TaxID=1740611 RepID=A0ABV6U6M0_9ACTN
MTGRLINGRYELLSQLGQGGMGKVWLAVDRRLGRRVALKEIVLKRSGSEPVAVQRGRARREAQALARISHPSVVEIHDVFEEGDTLWIVMAHVEGESLRDRISAGPLGEREIAGIGRDVLGGLTAAHAKGVLHRDVTPANILLGRDNKVFLIDFGIARIDGTSGLTERNARVGTMEYMAPERFNGTQTGPPLDLWSLGVTLYYALEGHSPFRRDTDPATLWAIAAEPLPRPRRQGPLFDAIAGLLEKDPGRRMRAAELDRRLAEIVRPAPRTDRYRSQRLPRPPAKPPVVHPTARPGPYEPAGGMPGTPDRPLPGLSGPSGPSGPNRGPHVRLTPEALCAAGPVKGGRSLLARPPHEAASLLAAVGPRAGGPLLDGMTAQPARAAAVLTLLPKTTAGRTVNHMSAEGAAELFRVLPPGQGAGILAYADERVVAEVLRTLGVASATVRLVEAMTLQRAWRVLEYVPPALIADLLPESLDGRGHRLLNGLSGPVRAEVARLARPT